MRGIDYHTPFSLQGRYCCCFRGQREVTNIPEHCEGHNILSFQSCSAFLPQTSESVRNKNYLILACTRVTKRKKVKTCYARSTVTCSAALKRHCSTHIQDQCSQKTLRIVYSCPSHYSKYTHEVLT